MLSHHWLVVAVTVFVVYSYHGYMYCVHVTLVTEQSDFHYRLFLSLVPAHLALALAWLAVLSTAEQLINQQLID